jgi:hypothetical protein
MCQTCNTQTRLSLTGEALHLVLLTQGSALAVGIDLGNDNFVLGVLKGVGEFFVLGCEGFTVTASVHVITQSIHGSLQDVPPRGKTVIG